MANYTNYLTVRLNNFDKNVCGSLDSLSAKATEVQTELNDIYNLYQSALNGVTSTWKDENSASAKEGLTLISNATTRLKDSASNELMGVIGKAGEVKEKIEYIKAKHKEGEGLEKAAWLESTVTRIINGISQAFTQKNWMNNDQAKIDSLNAEIDHYNKEAERMLDAIKAGMGGVSLGIVGNMVNGGALGSYSTFSYNYTEKAFTQKTWVSETIGAVGATLAGVVETPFKIVEGILDAGTTVVADVVSIFGGDASGIVNFVRKDYVGDWFEDNIYVGMLDDKDAFRTAGNIVGDIGVTAAAILSGQAWVLGLKATGQGGRTSESILNATNGNLFWATTGGTVVGLIDYFGSKKAQNAYKGRHKPTQDVKNLPAPDDVKNLPAPDDVGKLPAAGKTVQKQLKNGNLLLSDGSVVDKNGKFLYNAGADFGSAVDDAASAVAGNVDDVASSVAKEIGVNKYNFDLVTEKELDSALNSMVKGGKLSQFNADSFFRDWAIKNGKHYVGKDGKEFINTIRGTISLN